jgi:hypothetical protein
MNTKESEMKVQLMIFNLWYLLTDLLSKLNEFLNCYHKDLDEKEGLYALQISLDPQF